MGYVSAQEEWNGTGLYITRASTNANGEEANGYSSRWHSISANGRYVIFSSNASNLVDDGLGGGLFRKDLLTGEVVRVAEYGYFPSVSSGGRYVAFETSWGFSYITRKDLVTGEIVGVDVNANGEASNHDGWFPCISLDGRYVAFGSTGSNLVENDTNNEYDIFRKDMLTGEVVRVSTNLYGEEGNDASYVASMTPDGRYIAFESNASNLVPNDTNNRRDIFWKDLATGKIVRASTDTQGREVSGWGFSDCASISADGRYVAFISPNPFVPNDNNNSRDVFRKDIITGEIIRVTTNSQGEEANLGGSNYSYCNPYMSGDGRFIVFSSQSSNLVDEDFNGLEDIFKKDLLTSEVVRVSVNNSGEEVYDGGGSSDPAQISANGRFVSFASGSSNLVPDDTNNTYDIFVADMDLYPPAKPTIERLKSIVNNLNINKGIINSLLVKLNTAQEFIEEGKSYSAEGKANLAENCNKAAEQKLQAFMNEVEALRSKEIDEATVSRLTELAERIIDRI